MKLYPYSPRVVIEFLITKIKKYPTSFAFQHSLRMEQYLASYNALKIGGMLGDITLIEEYNQIYCNIHLNQN